MPSYLWYTLKIVQNNTDLGPKVCKTLCIYEKLTDFWLWVCGYELSFVSVLCCELCHWKKARMLSVVTIQNLRTFYLNRIFLMELHNIVLKVKILILIWNAYHFHFCFKWEEWNHTSEINLILLYPVGDFNGQATTCRSALRI